MQYNREREAEKMRDYSLTGPDSRKAIEAGLAAAEWYHSDIDRKVLRDLMQRRDGPPLRDTIILYGLMIGLAAAAIALWPGWWSAPFWLAYGVLYGSAGDSRWHECGHGTAFRTRWMNRVVYHIACFCMMRNPVTWQWSHARHHTDTIIVGRDPEITAMRPPHLFNLFLNFFGIRDVLIASRLMLMNAAGKLTDDEKDYIPEAEQAGVCRVARIWIGIYAAVIALAVYTGSVLPLMVIGLPRLYGAWHHVLTGILQHVALAEDVTDHRLNTRTVYMNPVSRFIYWNMNYHVEHHMFPMVPYYSLPRLHELIKDDLPAPNTSIWQAYREAWPVVLRQLRYHDEFLLRELPPTARPYREFNLAE